MFSLFNFSSIFPGGHLTPFVPMCGRPCRYYMPLSLWQHTVQFTVNDWMPLHVYAKKHTNKDWRIAKTIHKLHVHRESKKQDTKLLAITSLNIIRFSIFFSSRLGSKFATNSCLNIPPRFKHVATVPCEIWMQKNGIILKYVLQLIKNQKVA